MIVWYSGKTNTRECQVIQPLCQNEYKAGQGGGVLGIQDECGEGNGL